MKYTLLVISVLCLAACKKETDITNNPAAGGGDYIEFKSDGKAYQYIEKIGVTSTVLAIISTPSLPLYQISMVAYSTPAAQTINLQLISKTPLRPASIAIRHLNYQTDLSFCLRSPRTPVIRPPLRV